MRISDNFGIKMPKFSFDCIRRETSPRPTVIIVVWEAFFYPFLMEENRRFSTITLSQDNISFTEGEFHPSKTDFTHPKDGFHSTICTISSFAIYCVRFRAIYNLLNGRKKSTKRDKKVCLVFYIAFVNCNPYFT